MAESVDLEDGPESLKPTDPSRLAPQQAPAHIARGQAWPRYSLGAGAPGPGVPDGGLAHQVLAKRSAQGFDTEWRHLALPGIIVRLPPFLLAAGTAVAIAPENWQVQREVGDHGIGVTGNQLALRTGSLYQIIASLSAVPPTGGGPLTFELRINNAITGLVGWTSSTWAGSARQDAVWRIAEGATENLSLWFGNAGGGAVDKTINARLIVIELSEVP